MGASTWKTDALQGDIDQVHRAVKNKEILFIGTDSDNFASHTWRKRGALKKYCSEPVPNLGTPYFNEPVQDKYCGKFSSEPVTNLGNWAWWDYVHRPIVPQAG